MTQQQTAQVLELDRRSPERQVLHLAINDLKTAESNLAAANQAVSDDWNAKMGAEGVLTSLRTVAPDMGVVPLLSKIEQAVLAGVEPSIRYFNEEEEKFGRRVKSALQDIEFYNRRRHAREVAIPDEERAVGQARHKVKQAAQAVIRASDAVAQAMTDLETMHAAVISKRIELHFLISNDVVDDAEAAAVKRLMAMTLERQDWRRHPAALKWSDALERLMVDADAELPCG